MSVSIEKVYRTGNCWGIVYVTDEDTKDGSRKKRASTIVAGWASAPDAVRDCAYRLKERGSARRTTEAIVSEKLAERKISKVADAAPVEERATARQVGYASSLAKGLAYNAPWATTSGGRWFKAPPTDVQIAAMSKDHCSTFISAMIDRY